MGAMGVSMSEGGGGRVLCSFVHPTRRRNGLLTALLMKLLEEMPEWKELELPNEELLKTAQVMG